FSERSSGECYAVSVMDQTIHDRIPEGGIADAFVPVLHRYLACEQSCAASGSILDHLQKIAALTIAYGSKAPVIEDEEISLAELSEDSFVCSVTPCDHEIRQESRQPKIPDQIAVTTGAVS